MPFTLVFSQKHRCLLSCRTGVVSFPRWTEPWTHDLGTPWVGPPGPVGRGGGSGGPGPFRPIRGPFRPIRGPFSPVSRRFLHELGLDRAGHYHGHLGARSEARLRGLRAPFGPFVDRFRPFPRDFGLDRLGHYFPDVVRPFLRIVCCIYGPFGFEASVPFVPRANSCFSARTPRRSHGFAPEAHLRRASRGGDLASSMPSRRAPRLSKRSATVTRGESLTLRDESVRSRGWDGLGEPMFSSPDASPCDLAKFKLSRGLGRGGGGALGEPMFSRAGR